MRVQIRRGVFETNSSSTHSITIGSAYEKLNIKEIVGDEVTVGCTSKDEIDKLTMKTVAIDGIPNERKEVQMRLDMFWYTLITQYDFSASDYISLKLKLKSFFGKYGVKVTFNENPEIFDTSFLYSMGLDEHDAYLFYDIFHNEDFEMIFINYLFGDVVYYVFCDECCSSTRRAEIEIADCRIKNPTYKEYYR